MKATHDKTVLLASYNRQCPDCARLTAEHARLLVELDKAQVRAETATRERDEARAALDGVCDDAKYADRETDQLAARVQVLEAALREIITHYDAYRGKGVLPAREHYQRMVQAIQSGRAALAPASTPETPTTEPR